LAVVAKYFPWAMVTMALAVFLGRDQTAPIAVGPAMEAEDPPAVCLMAKIVGLFKLCIRYCVFSYFSLIRTIWQFEHGISWRRRKWD